MSIIDEKQPVDINLSETQRARFRIDGDNDRILELNISDMGIVTRLRDGYPKLDKLTQKIASMDDASELSDDEDEKNIRKAVTTMGSAIEEIDNEMRDIMDSIFDAKVSEVCAPEGTMYDLFNGKYRYEIILEKLLPLYNENMDKEYEAISKRVQKHTSKYTKRK